MINMTKYAGCSAVTRMASMLSRSLQICENNTCNLRQVSCSLSKSDVENALQDTRLGPNINMSGSYISPQIWTVLENINERIVKAKAPMTSTRAVRVAYDDYKAVVPHVLCNFLRLATTTLNMSAGEVVDIFHVRSVQQHLERESLRNSLDCAAVLTGV